MDKLIYDRTSADVEIALYAPDSKENLKGCYNYSDLNRVESWCQYIYECLKGYGFNENLIIKNKWNMLDFPTKTEIDRIRNNINSLKNYCIALNIEEEIVFDNTMNYQNANVLEKILYEIDRYINEMTMENNLHIGIASVLVEQEYLYLQTE